MTSGEENEIKLTREVRNQDLMYQEMKQFETAFKDKEFLKMFSEYLQEINDPDNRKKYEEEITKLEKEKGNNVVFLEPTPGFAVKCKGRGDKFVYINIAVNKNVDKVELKKDGQWHIPHRIVAPREDTDEDGQIVTIVDILMSPEIIEYYNILDLFKKMLVDISIDSANKNFDLGLDKDYEEIKSLKYKGNIYKSIIKEPSKDIQERKEETSIEYVEKMIGEKKQKELVTVTPKYTIIHRGEFDYSEYAYYSNNESRARKPKYLVLKIELPGLDNAKEIDVDVKDKAFVMKERKYYLKLNLPYSVSGDRATATFDKLKCLLQIVLPVSL